MAAVSIAFAAPDNSQAGTPSRERPIDLVHLARQTMGDKTREADVLKIFARQARASLQQMSTASASAGRAANELKGAAAVVGAFKVRAAAEAVETRPEDPAALASLSVAIIEAENFILKLSR